MNDKSLLNLNPGGSKKSIHKTKDGSSVNISILNDLNH